ncbi:hypothetical protein UFOVP855_42 [uncultured Caudovirales phage]|jgi:hypothetical protein|uniref:Uncharacterized protein n=1 Tax=uncultured Caudovirales phage TaxID=2100421 RepID=A0A6J5PW10_9CAUD|nr:hypothetical protein UFOVP527_19 [uncultured Caudovirales phage]CAB4167706.1 hypothetical protein UFOVP855_42 [uncultured Caudovirales phage]CAB4173591.1 hypothetical protein UFOVP954_32 [uncultured Caudovirales phage]CAB4179091.1 hypothetical protein UFOVP1026_29 [uncultured Caudovirales phage]CAB4188335.1 hypothetical protein UFOVP1180_13 [uncultured Caudovirales phage]
MNMPGDYNGDEDILEGEYRDLMDDKNDEDE